MGAGKGGGNSSEEKERGNHFSASGRRTGVPRPC